LIKSLALANSAMGFSRFYLMCSCRVTGHRFWWA